MSHTHRLSQKWCEDHFLDFIDKTHWLPNSPDMNPLNYSIWEEYAQAINWSRVKLKATLKAQLVLAVK